MKVFTTLFILMSLGLASCASQVPTSQPHPSVSQQKLQAAQHWNVLAASVAQRLRTALASVEIAGKPFVLHVQEPRYGTFNHAFHELLITQLLEQGFGVTDDPAAGLPVSYDVQLIAHRNRDYPHAFAGPAPDKEILVNISVMSGDRYITRISDIYYISESNYTHYLAQGPSGRLMEVVGP